MATTESTRPSVYLLQKAEALALSIAFFARSDQNRLVFLAQLDF